MPDRFKLLKELISQGIPAGITLRCPTRASSRSTTPLSTSFALDHDAWGVQLLLCSC
jgi:hypothetical protein